MEKNIFKAFQPNIMERLGKCCWQDDNYKQCMEEEKEIAERLRESLTEEQKALMDKYYVAVYNTAGICELLAYRQGMRDMVNILYGK